MANYHNVILFGPPGAGKSTLVETLREKGFDFSLVSMGQILREMAKEDSELGTRVKETMAKGDLLEDSLIIQLFKKYLHDVDKSKPLILDGYPRTLSQVDVVDESFINEELELPLLVYVKITKEEAVRRLSSRRVCSKGKENFQASELNGSTVCPKCGGEIIHREDDRPEAIEKRFDLFEMQFEIVRHYFKSRDRYYEIDGMGDGEKEKRGEELIRIMGE